MSFRWQTDEDTTEPVAQQQTAPSHRRLRRASWLLATLAILALPAFLAWRTVRQRADQTENRLRAEVLAVHNLARRAAEAGDDELYLSLLPPQIESWAATQERLLQDDLLFARAARFYDLAPRSDFLPGAPVTSQVTLDPTLSQATVLTEQSFAFTTTARLAAGFTLRQAHTYSLGETGWHVAPPPPDFWTPQVILRGARVTLHYPQRDEAVALRLMSQLERLLPLACNLQGLDCPPDLHLTVRLVPDPAALSHAAAPEALLRGALQIDLPAPSLVGQPLDETGETLAARAYAARTFAPLISHLSGYQCCARSLLARAILERQLHHLGLRPWPLTPDHYETLMEQGLTLGNALVLQSRDAAAPLPETWRQVLSLVEFLEASLPEGQLLSAMDASLEYWLLRADDPGQFVVQWTDFVYGRSRSARLAGGLETMPQGAIQLTCFEQGAVAVQRYELQGGGWQHSLTHAAQDGWQAEAVFPLPADYGYVVKESRRDAVGERVARYLWRHAGGAELLFETFPQPGGAPLFAPYDGSAPHWRYTVLSPDHEALRASVEQDWWQLDLTLCSGGDCRPQQRAARPRWSPGGAQLLLEVRPEGNAWGPDDLTLFRAGSRGQNAVEVGRGYAPVWLDASRYAYLRSAETQSGQELVVSATGDDRPRVLATSDDFVALLDEALPGGSSLQLQQLHVRATDPRLLLVHATRPPLFDVEPDGFLFAVRLTPDLQLSEVDLLFHSDGALHFRPSPNGRWIAVTSPNSWILIDLQQGAIRSLGAVGAPAWSPDGNWLVQSRDYHLMLHAPQLDYKRPIVHELGDCPFSSLQWQTR